MIFSGKEQLVSAADVCCGSKQNESPPADVMQDFGCTIHGKARHFCVYN